MSPTSGFETSSAEAEAQSSATTTEPSWAELLGSKQWAGLLNPLNPTLEVWLLRWCYMAQVTYDAFNKDTHSERCGACLYTKEELLTKTSFPYASDYEVVDLLYATVKAGGLWGIYNPVSPCSGSGASFQGYIAISSNDYAARTGRREIYVTWRGSETTVEWIKDVEFPQTDIKPLFAPLESSAHITPSSLTDEAQKCAAGVSEDEPRVAKAWYSFYTDSDPDSCFSKDSARTQLACRLKELVKLHEDEDLSMVCIGHSVGGTQAVLSAFDIAVQGLSKIKGKDDDYFPVTAVLFACPRIGNDAFRDLLDKQKKLSVIHVMNEGDIVPTQPPMWIPESGDYADSGLTIELDWIKSVYFCENPTYEELHKLQSILHLLAGWKSEEGELKMSAAAGGDGDDDASAA